MTELLSENKVQEMSSVVNKDSVDSRLESESLEDTLIEDNITLDKSGSKDIEHLDLLDEADSLKLSEKINGQSELQDGLLEPELDTIDGSFPDNEDAIVFEGDGLTTGATTVHDDIDDGVVPNDLENNSDISDGKQSSIKENDQSNSGKSRCILVYEGQEIPLDVKKLNKCLGEWMQDLKNDHIPDEAHDQEVILTFKDSVIDDFRLVLSQDNKYSQAFTLGKIITTHNKYRKSHDLNTTDLLIVMTLQDRFISQYRKYNDVAGEEPESLYIGDNYKLDYDNILPKSTAEMAQLSGTEFSHYSGGDNGGIQYIDSENWKNGAQGFYGVPQIYHQMQTNELYVNSQEAYQSGLGLYDEINHNMQFEPNDLYGDSFNELLNNFEGSTENFDGSSLYYNQTLENFAIAKESIYDETLDVKGRIYDETLDVKESIYDETLNAKESTYDETLSINNAQNNSEALKIDDKAPFLIGNEFNSSAMNSESKKDLPVVSTSDECSVNEMEVSKGKRERSCTSDSEEDVSKKARID